MKILSGSARRGKTRLLFRVVLRGDERTLHGSALTQNRNSDPTVTHSVTVIYGIFTTQHLVTHLSLRPA